jgi:hypothetical protein
VYHENDLKKQYVGPFAVGSMNLKQDGELLLAKINKFGDLYGANPALPGGSRH